MDGGWDGDAGGANGRRALEPVLGYQPFQTLLVRDLRPGLPHTQGLDAYSDTWAQKL